MNKEDESKKKKLSSVIKIAKIKSKIISYGFSLFSIGFLVFILTNVVNYYLTKYVFFLLNMI